MDKVNFQSNFIDITSYIPISNQEIGITYKDLFRHYRFLEGYITNGRSDYWKEIAKRHLEELKNNYQGAIDKAIQFDYEYWEFNFKEKDIELVESLETVLKHYPKLDKLLTPYLHKHQKNLEEQEKTREELEKRINTPVKFEIKGAKDNE